MRERFVRGFQQHLNVLAYSNAEQLEKDVYAAVHFFNESTDYLLSETKKDELARDCGYRDFADLENQMFNVLFEYLRRSYSNEISYLVVLPLYVLAGRGRDFANELEYFAGLSDASPRMLEALESAVAAFGEEARAFEATFDLPYVDAASPSQQVNVYVPSSARDASLPIVLFFHGGAWTYGDRISAIRRLRHFADEQVIFVSVGYRLSREAVWPAQMDDCLSAFQFVQENASEWGGDTKKMALWGSSAGAHLAALLAGKKSDQVAGLIDFCGPIDLELHVDKVKGAAREISPVMQLLGGDHPQTKEWAHQASVQHLISESYPRTLIVHGMLDDTVPVTESRFFARKLKECGVPVELLELPKNGHRLDDLLINERIKAFFKQIFSSD